MCEETRSPATQVPQAMVGTIILNTICGFIFLLPLCFVLPPLEEIISDPSGQPLPVILRSAIGNEGGAFALCIPIIVLGIICGTGCTTASSRTVWAFSRDGAIPGSKWLKQVNPKLNVPLNAMMASMAFEILLACIYFGSAAAFNAFNGAGVIFLTLSYVMPVFVSFVTGRKALKSGVYDLGLFGWICNVICIGKKFSSLARSQASKSEADLSLSTL